MFNFNIYKILAILSLGISFLLCVVLVIISVKQEWCGQQMLWILWPASLSTAHAQIQNSRKNLFQSSQGRAKVCSNQIFYQHSDNLNMRHQGDSLEKIFSFCFKLSTFSCIAVSPNLLSVIDVLHTYDDSNCSIWRRHHLVRHSLGNLMKGIFRKTCFDTIQNSKRDLSIWKRLPPPPIPFICANLCFIFFRDPIWH